MNTSTGTLRIVESIILFYFKETAQLTLFFRSVRVRNVC